MNRSRPVLKAAKGTRLSPNLTVLSALDAGSVEPVYVVWHHALCCPVACKIMTSATRARAEAGVLAQFAHPNILRPLGVEAPCYLLMPLLEGPSLAALMDMAPGRQLGLSNALRIAIHVGAALTHVHAQGYVHLDVKPDNIIVTPGGRPVLFDFGTARRIRARRPAEAHGTDAYISPQECRLEPVDAKADVFSLGVVLYEMLTDALPFGKGTRTRPFPQAAGRAPVPVRERRPRVPVSVARIIQSCLADDPHARPALSSLLPALNRHITNGPPMWPDGFEPFAQTRPKLRLAHGEVARRATDSV